MRYDATVWSVTHNADDGMEQNESSLILFLKNDCFFCSINRYRFHKQSKIE